MHEVCYVDKTGRWLTLQLYPSKESLLMDRKTNVLEVRKYKSLLNPTVVAL